MESKLSFLFTGSEVQLIVTALQEMPYKTAAPMINNIVSQVNQNQVQAEQSKEVKEEKPIKEKVEKPKN